MEQLSIHSSKFAAPGKLFQKVPSSLSQGAGHLHLSSCQSCCEDEQHTQDMPVHSAKRESDAQRRHPAFEPCAVAGSTAVRAERDADRFLFWWFDKTMIDF